MKPHKYLVLLIVLLLIFQIGSGSAQESLPPNLRPIMPDEPIVPLMRFGYGRAEDVAWSPNGETLAIATSIGVWLYDASDLQAPPVKVHDSVFGARTVTYSPDGRFLAAGGSEVHVWDAETHALIRTFDAEKNVFDLAFSPDSSQLIISHGFGATSNDLKIWDIESGRERITLANGIFDDLTFSPDGVYIAGVRLADASFNTYIWEAASGETLFYGDTEVNADDDLVAFSPDGQTLLAVDRFGSFSVLDARTREILHTIANPNPDELYPSEVAFLPDGDSLLTVSQSGMLRIWETETYTITETVDLNWDMDRASLSPDGNRIAAINQNGNMMRVWDIPTGELITQRENFIAGNPVVDFSPDGALLAMTGIFSKIWIWNVASGMPVLTIPVHEPRIHDLDFSSDGTVLVSSSRDGTVRVWDTTSGELQHTITTNEIWSKITAIIDSQNRLLIADNNSIQLYDLATYEPIAWFHDVATNTFSSQFETEELIRAVSFEHDRLAVATGIGSIYFWEKGKKTDITHEFISFYPNVIAFYKRDDHNLIFAGQNSVVFEWSSSGIRVLTPHNSWIYALVSHETVIASAGCAESGFAPWDGSPQCTGADLRIGSEHVDFYFTIVSQANGHTAPIQDIAFNHDGTLLATASDDGTILLWGNPGSNK